MTVGRSLRNPEQVSVVLCDKIVAALDKLDYIPNRASNILSNAISRAIGVLLPSLTNQVFVKVLRGIESIADAHSYQVMLAHYGYKPEVEQERLESMLSWSIDGLILTERTHTPCTLRMVEVAGIPVVELMDNKPPRLDIAVSFDNFEVARQMATAIIAHGHRHVAYPGACLDERTIVKQKGHERVMLDVGLVSYSAMVKQPSFYSSSIELICQVRREYPQLDNMFCTNDDLVVDTAFECQCLGLKVPGDMAIAGLHGHDIGQIMEPRLVGVLVPRERVGSIGAGRLLTRTRGESVTPKTLDLSFTLSLGGSI